MGCRAPMMTLQKDAMNRALVLMAAYMCGEDIAATLCPLKSTPRRDAKSDVARAHGRVGFCGWVLATLILGLLVVLPCLCEVTIRGQWAVHIHYGRVRAASIERLKSHSGDECRSERRSPARKAVGGRPDGHAGPRHGGRGRGSRVSRSGSASCNEGWSRS